MTATEEEIDKAMLASGETDREIVSADIILNKSAEFLRRLLGQSVSRHN